MNRFNKGDVVRIRDSYEPARVINEVYEDGVYWYEVEAINLHDVPHREVKWSDLHLARRIVDSDDGDWRYFDKNLTELHDGDIVQYSDGRKERLYYTNNRRLGIDATNRKWIESGRAVPCQYGIYPLNHEDVQEIVKVS